MKKLVSLIASLLSAVMLTATGFAASEPDAYSLYKKAAASLTAADSIEMSVSGSNGTTSDGEEADNLDMYDMLRMLRSADGKWQFEGRCIYPELDMTQTTYYKDGWMYTHHEGFVFTGDDQRKFKGKIEIEDAVLFFGYFETGLTRDMLENVSVEETEEGKLVRFRVDRVHLKHLYFNDIEEMHGNSLPDGVTRTDGYARYSILLGPGNDLKSYSVIFDKTTDYYGTSFRSRYSATYTIHSINKIKSIDFPADLSLYK